MNKVDENRFCANFTLGEMYSLYFSISEWIDKLDRDPDLREIREAKLPTLEALARELFEQIRKKER